MIDDLGQPARNDLEAGSIGVVAAISQRDPYVDGVNPISQERTVLMPGGRRAGVDPSQRALFDAEEHLLAEVLRQRFGHADSFDGVDDEE